MGLYDFVDEQLIWHFRNREFDDDAMAKLRDILITHGKSISAFVYVESFVFI